MPRRVIFSSEMASLLHPSLLAFLGLLWGISGVYFPIIAPGVGEQLSWSLGALTTFFCLLSLIFHHFSHWTLSRILAKQKWKNGSLGFLGDLAQERECQASPLKEFLISLAGPLANGVLAVISFFLWNLQLGQAWNAAFLFLMIYNLFLGAINFSPFFPFDGGRMLLALLPWLGGKALVLWGRVSSLILSLWGLLLLFQKIQFGKECGFFALTLALLIMWETFGKTSPCPFKKNESPIPRWKILIFLLLLPLMLFSFLAFLPIPWGLEAPGEAAEVEGMVKVPEEILHQSRGHFLLTSVYSQTPILFSQLLYVGFDPAVDLVPPERVISREISPAQWTRKNFQDLEESQSNAIFVALNAAGYTATLEGEGAQVISIMEDSPSRGILKEGDLIVEAEGRKVTGPEDLSEALRSFTGEGKVQLKVKRGEETLKLEITPIYPKSPEEKPRLGIYVQAKGLILETPFPVEIFPQKIIGGPSAGLMFALTIYDLITPGDLTGGKLIAGTGTIERDGKVGPVGGVRRKVVSAQRAGAEYFLCPEENFDEALKYSGEIKVIKIKTFKDAINFLGGLKGD